MFADVHEPMSDETMNLNANVELADCGGRAAPSESGSLAPTDDERVNEIRGSRPHAPRFGSTSNAILRGRRIVDQHTWMRRGVSNSSSEFPTETPRQQLGPASARRQRRHPARIRGIYRPQILRSEFQHDGSVRDPIWTRGCTLHPGRRLTGSAIVFHGCRSTACGGGTKFIQSPFNGHLGSSQTKSILAAMPLSFDQVNLVAPQAFSTETRASKQLPRSEMPPRAHQISVTNR